MDDSDKHEFTAIMKGLAVNAGVELSKDVLRLYFEALKGCDISDIDRAAKKVLMAWSYNRMPPIAILVSAIQGTQPRIEDSALTEATRILDHIRRHGATMWPEMPDPITRHLLSTRWYYPRWAATVVESELKWWVKEFCEAYAATNAVNPVLEIPDSVKPLIEHVMDGKNAE